jgi:phosphatidylglycerol:prolipoprotein diacylglycerol transferase
MFCLNIDKVAFTVLGIEIYWYGILYSLALCTGWMLATGLVNFLRARGCVVPTKKKFDSFMLWTVVWAVVGARLGHVLFFDLKFYLENKLEIFMLRNGGMAFHGGILATLLYIVYFCKKYRFQVRLFFDVMAISASGGVFVGRIANFLNQELYGKVASVWSSVVFSSVDSLPRHPTQIYESIFDGLLPLLTTILMFKTSEGKVMGKGVLSGTFCVLYSISRFIIEFYKEVEVYSIFCTIYLTTGQMLSAMLFLVGIACMFAPSKIRERTQKI